MIIGGLCTLTGCPNANTPCTSGTDVRNLTVDPVSNAVQMMVYGSPGPLITKTLSSGLPNQNFPTGTVVVIPFETPDFPRNTAITPAATTQEFFGTTGTTIANFYKETSWGQFTLKNGGVSDWVTLDKKLTSYVGFEGDNVLPTDSVSRSLLRRRTRQLSCSCRPTPPRPLPANIGS
jgi:hypothetical protein